MVSEDKTIGAADTRPKTPQTDTYVCCGLPVGNKTKVHSCRKCALPVHTIVLCNKVYLQDEQEGHYLCGKCVAGVLPEQDAEEDDQKEEEQQSDCTEPFVDDQDEGVALEESNEDDVLEVKYTPKHHRPVIESSDEESSNSGDEGFYDDAGLPKLENMNSPKLLIKSRDRADNRIRQLPKVDQEFMDHLKSQCDRSDLRLISGAAELPMVLADYDVARRWPIREAGVRESSNELVSCILYPGTVFK